MPYDENLLVGKMKISESKIVVIEFPFLEAMMNCLEKSEYRVLLYIISKTKPHQGTPVKIKKRKLAEKLNLSAPGVIKALRGLEDKGFVEEISEASYRLCLPPDEDDDDDDFDDVKDYLSEQW